MIHESITPDPRSHDAFAEEQIRNAYRECSVFFLGILAKSIAHICAAESQEVGHAQVRFALGIIGRSMSDEAARLNVSVQCISKGAWDFIDKHNLPTPPCMESDKSRKSHKQARQKQLIKNDQ